MQCITLMLFTLNIRRGSVDSPTCAKGVVRVLARLHFKPTSNPTSLPASALSQPSTRLYFTTFLHRIRLVHVPSPSLSHVGHVTHLTLVKMFYSHEILTSRKYGVATVWYASRLTSAMQLLADHSLHRLVATLGSKSNLKKVSRKAILDVDVAKTCSTIIDPVAPMALRLSSSLLYVSHRAADIAHDA